VVLFWALDPSAPSVDKFPGKEFRAKFCHSVGMDAPTGALWTHCVESLEQTAWAMTESS
jgi:hypothetical protein